MNRYFYPDHAATAQMLSDLAFALARDGWAVRVVTSRLLYDDPVARLPAEEVIAGVRVSRVPALAHGRRGMLGRMIDYLSFWHAVARALPRIVGPGDIVVAMTDPPLLSILVAGIARRRGARLVTWLQDLYPEVAAALGVPGTSGLVGRLARGLRNRSLRKAAANVAIGEAMAGRLRDEGIAPERICIIHNWADDAAIVPQSFDGTGLRSAWGFGPRDFVVCYSGNLGRAHEVETLLGAAMLLADRSDIVFLMIGGGSAAARLRARVAALGLPNFRFRPYQPRAALAQSLAVANVHWLSLRPELEGLILPSKLYGIAAAGRPIVAIVDPAGNVAQMVRDHGCGLVVAPGESAALAASLAAWADAPAAAQRCGDAARAMLEQRFGFARAVAQWSALLRSLDQASKA